MKQLTRKLT